MKLSRFEELEGDTGHWFLCSDFFFSLSVVLPTILDLVFLLQCEESRALSVLVFFLPMLRVDGGGLEKGDQDEVVAMLLVGEVAVMVLVSGGDFGDCQVGVEDGDVEFSSFIVGISFSSKIVMGKGPWRRISLQMDCFYLEVDFYSLLSVFCVILIIKTPKAMVALPFVEF